LESSHDELGEEKQYLGEEEDDNEEEENAEGLGKAEDEAFVSAFSRSSSAVGAAAKSSSSSEGAVFGKRGSGTASVSAIGNASVALLASVLKRRSTENKGGGGGFEGEEEDDDDDKSATTGRQHRREQQNKACPSAMYIKGLLGDIIYDVETTRRQSEAVRATADNRSSLPLVNEGGEEGEEARGDDWHVGGTGTTARAVATMTKTASTTAVTAGERLDLLLKEQEIMRRENEDLVALVAKLRAFRERLRRKCRRYRMRLLGVVVDDSEGRGEGHGNFDSDNDGDDDGSEVDVGRRTRRATNVPRGMMRYGIIQKKGGDPGGAIIPGHLSVKRPINLG